MAVDREKNKIVKVTVPNELWEKLKAIADSRGIPMSQLFLQATLDRYKDDL